MTRSGARAGSARRGAAREALPSEGGRGGPPLKDQAFGLRERGIDYVYDARNRSLIPDAARARVEELRQQIIAGKIVAPTEPSK